MTRIILVRHAECEGNILNCLTGRTDFKLTEKGKQMANDLLKELKKYEIHSIYSSVSIRCIDTVKPTAEYFKLKIITEKDLMEKSFGIYDGMTWDDVNRINPQIMKNKIRCGEIIGIPKQESTNEVAQRMNKCIKDIIKENKNKTILICSHGCSIFAFLNDIKYIKNIEERKIYSQSNASINILEYENEEFKIKMINKTNHLK